MIAVHQFVAGLANGDAISNEARVMRGLFRGWGFESEIFSETRRILPELRGEARDAAAYAPQCRPDDVVLLHLSIGSDVNDLFASLRCRKAILYHNITPSQYFDVVNRTTAHLLARGREQAKRLAGSAAVTLADSRFNADELAGLGYREVRVLPLLLDPDAAAAAPDRRTLRKLDDGRVCVLFVGRCAPNKKIEDLLKAFFFFQAHVEPNSRFVHVGSHAGAERYYHTLLAYVRELGLDQACFAGAVPLAQLNAYYRSAALFLCMSEHEGFCIPILESMAHNVPVLAYAAAAVPETMDGAGVLFTEKRFEAVAEMMGRLSREGELRSAVIRGQQERMVRYRRRELAAELRGHLAPLLSPEQA